VEECLDDGVRGGGGWGMVESVVFGFLGGFGCEDCCLC